jgi:phosphatidylglycerophosphatase A
MNIKRLFTSCYGLGFAPVASGTFGSIPPVVIFMALSIFEVNWLITAAIMFILAVDFSFFTVMFSKPVIDEQADHDPSEIVSDEVAGQSLTLLMISPIMITQPCWVSVLAFFFFRLFDVLKPFPCKRLEKLPLGWGILMDDIAAGIYAGAVMIAVIKYFNL